MSEMIDALALTWTVLLLVYGAIATAVLGVRWIVRQLQTGEGSSPISVE